MSQIAVKTKVRILAFVGPTFERDWSETGRIVKHDASWRGREHEIPEGYHTVRYDRDGAVLMIHRQRLMVANDQ